MASLQVSFILSAIFLACFLASPAYSLTCKSQMFNKGQVFKNCTDLPQLNSYLHYTYNSSNSTLSIAFIASPPTPEGWVSYAINLDGSKMVGAQALVAFKDNKSGAVAVKTYDLISYSEVKESKLSFDVWDLSAEENKKQFTIFAKLKVPSKINQVWQVGPSVDNGMPKKHGFEEENLKSYNTLELMGPGPGPGPAPAPEGEHQHGDGGVKMTTSLSFLVSLLMIARVAYF